MEQSEVGSSQVVPSGCFISDSLCLLANLGREFTQSKTVSLYNITMFHAYCHRDNRLFCILIEEQVSEIITYTTCPEQTRFKIIGYSQYDTPYYRIILVLFMNSRIHMILLKPYAKMPRVHTVWLKKRLFLINAP